MNTSLIFASIFVRVQLKISIDKTTKKGSKKQFKDVFGRQRVQKFIKLWTIVVFLAERFGTIFTATHVEKIRSTGCG